MLLYQPIGFTSHTIISRVKISKVKAGSNWSAIGLLIIVIWIVFSETVYDDKLHFTVTNVMFSSFSLLSVVSCANNFHEWKEVLVTG